MFNESLAKLIEVSARVGKNLDLVQAGGGNTSMKDAGTLWVKASGKWLSRAAEEEMFLPVPMSDIERQLQAEDEKFPEYRTPGGVSLRPSVETAVHAVLPHKVVIHVHSVRTIAWASRTNGATQVTPLLNGLRWSWIPYTHPGIPLAMRIRRDAANQADVLILENHGLVVAADTCEKAEALLQEVEQRLHNAPWVAPKPDLSRLAALSQGSEWEVAADEEVHALGAPFACQIAAQGTLFPDQCVYLGPAAAVVDHAQSLAATAEAYEARYNFAPRVLLVKSAGVLTMRGINRAAQELLIALKRVIERIPENSPVRYLPPSQVARLMNWDAEKYRIAMAKREN